MADKTYISLPRDQMIEELEVGLGLIAKTIEFYQLIIPTTIQILKMAKENSDFGEVAIPDDLAEALGIVGTRMVVVRSSDSEPESEVQDDTDKSAV